MPTTTTMALTDAMREALTDATPRFERGSTVAPWKYHTERRRDVGLGLRWYTFEWIPQGRTANGLVGHLAVEVDVHLHMITDYGSTPEDVVEHMAQDDHFWLRDTFAGIRHLTPGWRTVLSLGWDFTAFSKPDRHQVDHMFLVRYMQERRV